MKIKKKAHELEFISQISRDGSGTFPVRESYLEFLINNEATETFKLHRLSLSEDTYIAISFNAFVVKIKPVK